MLANSDFYISLSLMLLVAAGCFFAARRLNRYSLQRAYPTPVPERFSFGLILIFVLLLMGLLNWLTTVPGFTIWEKGFWSNGAREPGEPINRVQEVYFALAGVFTFCGTTFSLWLLFGKRDIFPKVFTWFLYINTGMYCVAVVAEKWMMTGSLQYSMDEIRIISVNIALVLILLWYINTSGRVKRVCVLPHPSLVDHG